MRRKPTNGAGSKLVLDVPAELDTILKYRGRGTASPLLADRLVSLSAATAGDAEALGREVKKGLRRRYRTASPA